LRGARLALALAAITGGSLVIASAATLDVDEGAPLQVIHQPAEGITTSTSSTTTSTTDPTLDESEVQEDELVVDLLVDDTETDDERPSEP
jgi:hypothetical protein